MHHNFSDSYFHEKLWFEGKCIGHIEGVIVFQNNPMVRQMMAGVNTDDGFLRISPPILGKPIVSSGAYEVQFRISRHRLYLRDETSR